MIKRICLLILSTFLLVGSTHVAGQDRAADYDNFMLFNYCYPVELVVEELSSDAKKIGLTEERMRTMTESRLRAARIYSDDGSTTYLYVNVNVVGKGFHTSVSFRKLARVFGSDHLFPATTWSIAYTGHMSGDSGFIMQGLSELVDAFINEYLRVNTEVCN